MDTFSFSKVSNVATECLTWTADGVYTCASEFSQGFTVGFSVDEGANFDPLLHLPCVRGPLACAPGTSVDQYCGAEWESVAAQIGHDKCMSDGIGAVGGSAGSTGSSSETVSSAAGAGAGGEDATTGHGTTAHAGDHAGGCACALASRRIGWTELLAGAAALGLISVRRRSRPRHR